MKRVLIYMLGFQLLLFSVECDSLKFYTQSAVLETDSGSLRITFFDNEAPDHVKNFKELVDSGFYDGKPFHRVIPDFVIQAGRDSSTPYRSIDPEISKIHFKGAVAMARQNDDINPLRRSDGYEFYICLRPQPELDGKYTVFGRVAEGFGTAGKIAKAERDAQDKPYKEILIKKAYLETFFDPEKFEYFRRKSETE